MISGFKYVLLVVNNYTLLTSLWHGSVEKDNNIKFNLSALQLRIIIVADIYFVF